MWEAEAQRISRGYRFRLAEDGTPLSARRQLELLQNDDQFAHWWTGIIATSPYQAVYLELPPLSESTLDEAAEFVVMDAPRLARMTADPRPFSERFARRAGDDIIVFPNLGGDALLIVPTPFGPDSPFTHLAEFLRHAPAKRVRSLWRVTAETAAARICATPLWLSTAGDAVAWLHLRLDSRPKYYHHQPYMAPR